jgi:NADH-quinone oxidoreductase subunit J
MINTIFFYIFTALSIISASMVITVKNPIYSALFLVLTFVNSAGLLFLLEIEFISLMFIIVYVGAIAILFLFVIMMLDVKITNFKKDIFKYFPIGIFLSFIIFLEILAVLNQHFNLNPYATSVMNNIYVNCYTKIDSITNIETLGQILYTTYLFEFLIAGLILLLAVICAVVLTNTVSINEKKQTISRQISRKYVS